MTAAAVAREQQTGSFSRQTTADVVEYTNGIPYGFFAIAPMYDRAGSGQCS